MDEAVKTDRQTCKTRTEIEGRTAKTLITGMRYTLQSGVKAKKV